MKTWLVWFQRLFACALKAYPKSYRDEFGAEMLGVLSETLHAAANHGLWTLFGTFWREVRDLPFNIIRVHLEKEPKMMRKFYVQATPLVTRSIVGLGLGSFVATLVSQLLYPLIFPLSLAIATLLSGWKLTQAYPTTGAYQYELQIALNVLRTVIFGLILAFALKQIISAKKVLLVWCLGVILPSLIFQTYLVILWSHSQAPESSQINYVLGGLSMFIRVLNGIAIGYLFGHLAQDKEAMPWFLFVGAVGYALLGFIGQQIYPGENLNTGLQWSLVSGAFVYSLIFALLTGLMFGLVLIFSTKRDAVPGAIV